MTVSFAVFLFFSCMLAVPVGYTVGPAILLITSVYVLSKRPRLDLSYEDKRLVYLLLVVFLVALFMYVYHANRVRSLDLPSRYVLAVPVLFMLLGRSPRLSWLWAGLITGCVCGAALALWQAVALGLHRPSGFTGVIQFGDLGLAMGVFCVAGLFWAATQARYARQWQLALVLGAVAGGCVSVISGSRGGWIALPLVLVLFLVAFLNRQNLARAMGLVLVLCAGLAILVVTVPSLKTRYTQAVSDVQKFDDGVADTSIGARLALWDALFIMIPQKPVLGWSEKDYHIELKRLVAEKKAKPVILQLANTHNNYLELWVFQGFIGLLAVLALMFAAFWSFCRRLRSDNMAVRVMAVCGASLLACYAVFGTSQVILGRNNTLLFFLVSLVVFWACMRREENKDRRALT
ncbi:O-antigen ligase family protein [Paralcaligenes ureilyticus]|uniref:O-antigen ligase family protein n=1 Tax=Paralcaligenes ureilyticus TaxID=627131 RepID=UPI00140436E8|nr:O-antigen ligase family protein [Paralcaligenes ureilyticus]